MGGVMDATQRCGTRDCGAQAYWITYVNGADLIWCNHHFRVSEEKLRLVSEWVIDDRPDWMGES